MTITMIADKRRRGRVRPAYWWGTGIYVGVFLASMALAFSPLGYAITNAVIAGTPGAARPMAAFLPPGFTMRGCGPEQARHTARSVYRRSSCAPDGTSR